MNTIQSKAQRLFKTIISQQQIKQSQYTSTQNQKQLLAICSHAGTLFYRKINKKSVQILTFLDNYHKMILNLHLENHSDNNKQYHIVASMINNISLHFILLTSYNLIQSQNQSSAKKFLKMSTNYIDSIDPDPILLSTALSNLSLLLMRKQKYYKSISYLNSVVNILESEIKNIKQESQHRKQSIAELMVFLVNGYINLSKCLSKVIRKNNKQYYRGLLQDINRKGLKKSIKYLGRTSYFTNRFLNQVQEQFDHNLFPLQVPLPVYKAQVYSQQQEEVQPPPPYQKMIMEELKRIGELIQQNNKKQPKVVYMEPKQPPPPQKYLASANQQTVGKLSFKVNDWEVQIEIYKDKNKHKVGTIVINCTRGRDHVHTVIFEQKLFKMLSQMNIYDFIPYQCQVMSLLPDQFIKYCVMSFLFIQDNNNLQLYPRNQGVVSPLVVTFLQKQSLVFINHILNNNYRLAICPTEGMVTYHLDIQFKAQFLQQLVSLKQQSEPNIWKIYQQLTKQIQRKNQSVINQCKQLEIKEEQKFIKAIQKIVENFQRFLMEKKNTEEINIMSNQQEYYKFVQLDKKTPQGRLYFSRFNQKSQNMEVYAENTFKTYGKEGKIHAKGNHMYNLSHLSQDLGIIQDNLSLLLSQMSYYPFKFIAEIVCRKFSLKYYDNPLSFSDLETYQQNAIMQHKLTYKPYLRKMVRYNDYVSPVTISLVSINNAIPIGIRLTIYDQIICQQAGYFIHINADLWKWPPTEQNKKNPYEDILYSVVEQYPYKKDYLLVEWLERGGLRKIFQLAKINANGDLEMVGLGPCFDRIGLVLDKLTK